MQLDFSAKTLLSNDLHPNIKLENSVLISNQPIVSRMLVAKKWKTVKIPAKGEWMEKIIMFYS